MGSIEVRWGDIAKEYKVMSTRSSAMTFNEALQRHIEDWRTAHPGEPWEKETVAQWMIDKGYWKPTKRKLRKELAKLLARAANLKRVTNPQGRRVRVYHAATFDVPSPEGGMMQKTLWDHRETMTAHFAHTALGQRWDQAAGFCKSLHNDQLDFNDNNPNALGNESQLKFDFTKSLQEPVPQKVEAVPVLATAGVAKDRRERDDIKPR